ncbi:MULTISPECIES: hypothetical protein [Sphingomonadales]|uniref:Uncharacterized protein n=2 Tax=Sphingomonadales TaxID=204457 RepID=A0A0A7PMF6_9SPHN|nr:MULTISPECIES: hypothetical protein [Sphingomonadaceae]AJA11165.1 hypothetical protein SKP52_21510 [Sphingopyxis fribergensis]OHT22294.1 hypothetical protein BHE75_04321 [Sphingomonas haloaromaticamans]
MTLTLCRKTHDPVRKGDANPRVSADHGIIQLFLLPDCLRNTVGLAWHPTTSSLGGSVSGISALSDFTLFDLQTLHFAFKHFPYEGSAPLTPDQFVNPIAQTFGQTDIG